MKNPVFIWKGEKNKTKGSQRKGIDKKKAWDELRMLQICLFKNWTALPSDILIEQMQEYQQREMGGRMKLGVIFGS